MTAPKDDATRKLAKVAALIEVQDDLLSKLADVRDEIAELLAGRAGIGEHMRDFERHFDALWSAKYAGGRSGAYAWAHTKDKPHVKRLVKQLGCEELKARAVAYFKSTDPFYVNARHTFSVFVASINTHAGLSRERHDFDLSAPVDCRHVPPCRTDVEHTQRKMADTMVVR